MLRVEVEAMAREQLMPNCTEALAAPVGMTYETAAVE
jgi:hypothetical protein